MSKISAGSTHVQQYAPPFVVSNLVANNWQLRWNATLKAFEASAAGTFANIGSGTAIVPTPTTITPLEFRTLSAGDRIALEVVSDTIRIRYNLGFATKSGTSLIGSAERLVGVTDTSTAVTLTLPGASSIPAGDTITIKDQTGGANANNITIDTAGGNIDGGPIHTINTNYGYVTVYSDGTNYFIISQG